MFTPHQIKQVIFEPVEQRTGWALFIRNKKEAPEFAAFFPSKQLADDHVRICNASANNDDHLYGADLSPAIIVESRILCSDHINTKLAVEAFLYLLGKCPVPASEIDAWRQEASTKKRLR